MAKTETIYAPVSWGELNALRSLEEKVGAENVLDFKREETEHGPRFAAVVKLAGDNPFAKKDDDKEESDDSDSDSDDGGGDKPAFLKSDDEKSEGSDDGDSESDSGDEDSSGDDDRDKPPFEEEGDDGPKSEGEALNQLLDLAKSIAEHFGISTGDDLGMGDELGPDAGGDLGGPPGPEGLDLPDVGAPPAGGPALPPPVPAPHPAGGMGKPKPGAMPSFARVAGYEEAKEKKRSFDALLQEAGAVSNQTIMTEAATFFPEHRVAKIDRTSKADENVAVVTLVKR